MTLNSTAPLCGKSYKNVFMHIDERVVFTWKMSTYKLGLRETSEFSFDRFIGFWLKCANTEVNVMLIY